MTSRERFLAVLNGKMPDRVPVTLFIQDQGHFLNQVYPNVDPQDFETLQLKVIEIQRQFGVDVFVRMLFGLNDPLSIHMGGLNVSQQSDRWEVHTAGVAPGHDDRVAIDHPHARRRADAGVFAERASPGHVRLRLHAKADQDARRSRHRDQA